MSGKDEENYRMVDVDFDDKDMELITPANIFKEWSPELIAELAEMRGVPTTYSKGALRKEGLDEEAMIVENLSKDIVSAGEKLLIRSFDKAILDQLTAPVQDSLKEAQAKKDGKPVQNLSKSVLQKRLAELVDEAGGIAPYVKTGGFKSNDQKTIYKGLLNYFGADTLTEKRENLYNLVDEEINTFSLKNAFSSIPTNFLRSVCEHMRLDHGNCTSANILADCIIKGEHYQPREVKPKKGTKLKKKPKTINKKLKKEDLVYWYKATELRDFCQESGLRVTGKKAELAKRIVDFFDPEKENDVPKERGERSRSRSKSRGRGKKAAATSEKSEKAKGKASDSAKSGKGKAKK